MVLCGAGRSLTAPSGKLVSSGTVLLNKKSTKFWWLPVYNPYMDAFKRVMDSTSKIQMDYICLQYPGYYRFAKWMERLAQGIADGVIEVPKDH
ncbi:hypothetical protein [Candidatus Erwinia dacicola]|nr:hypothetical protein [Candidatus Erwinia dacicola]